MKFSVWCSYERPWSETLELATWAEQTGWHGFWYADHFMSQTDDDTPGDGMTLECWSVLAAVAATVPRLRLTSMVSPVTIHHPVVLAKRVATVDHISGGRAVLGMGAGWQVNEHQSYGFDLKEPGERVSHFIEAIQVVRSLLHDERTNFDGTWYHLTDAPFEPKRGGDAPVPILVGTGSPRMLRATARYADEWNTWGDPTLVAERTATYNEACAAVDRDPATMHRSAQAMLFFADDDAAREKVAAFAPAGRSLIGSGQQLIDLIGGYVELGVDEFALPDFTLGNSHAQRMDAFARFHSEVMSAF